ncbi:glycoside hydrolase family protein [Venturia nashicola]|nr:glycoside hydrolase family protein [Venturia nashicola]
MALRFLLTAALAASTVAQTFTDCNPMNKTCPPNIALGTANQNFDFTNPVNTKVWNQTAGPMTYQAKAGAQFTIQNRGESPTIKSNFYLMWGSVTVFMVAARGQGIVSSIVLQSDDLDEVDWEILGGNTTHVESNYFGKGNQTSFDRAIWHPVTWEPQADYHNYTTHWTKETLEWWIDGVLVRTLKYGDTWGNGLNYPQTPMNIRLGIWAGGDKNASKGTIEWAGGLTDYAKAPFSMFVKNCTATDFSTGATYEWTDKSGSYQSIKATGGNSTVLNAINAPVGVTGHWNALSVATRTGILVGALGGFAVLFLASLIFCCVQGKKGREEKAIADAEWEKEQAEFSHYRMQMMKGGFGQSNVEPVPGMPPQRY